MQQKERNFNKFQISQSLYIKLSLNTVNLKTDTENINYFYNNLILKCSTDNNKRAKQTKHKKADSLKSPLIQKPNP